MDLQALGLRESARVSLVDEEATENAGRDLAHHLRAGDFLGLIGDLGAGKTCFVRGLLKGLEASDQVQSPTYTLVNTYDCEPPVHHFDLYRLESYDDLEGIGYWDYLDKEHLIVVEWLDRVPEAWPGKGVIVTLKHLDNGREMVLWSAHPVSSR